MGAENESIGGIAVQIVGNYAPLLEDIQEATSAAASGGAKIAEALTAGAAGADALSSSVTAAALGLGTFESQIEALVNSGSTLAEALAAVQASTVGIATGVEEAGAAAAQAAEQLSLFDAALEVPYADAAGQLNMFTTELEPIPAVASAAAGAVTDLAAAAQAATQPVTALGQAEENAGDSAHHAESGVASFSEKLIALGEALVITDGLIEFGKAALEAADAVDDATKAIGMLGHGAEEAQVAVDQLRKIASDDALSFPQLLKAGARMTAFLGSAEEVPGVMRVVADSAAVMSSSIDGSSRAFERLVSGGDLSKRSLLALGLTLGDVAKALGTTEEKAKTAFGALDQSEKIEVMEKALGKFAGAAKALSDDALGAMVRLGQGWSQVLEKVGAALDPVIKQLADFVTNDFLPFVNNLVAGFNALPEPVKEAIIVFGALAAAVVPVTLALGAFGLAISAASTALAPLVGVLGAAASVIGVGFVGALAAATLGFHDLNEGMTAARKKYDEVDQAFQKYIEHLAQGAHTGEQVEAAQKKIQAALDAGVISLELAAKAMAALTNEGKKLAGADINKTLDSAGISIRLVADSAGAAVTKAEAFRIKMTSLGDAVRSTKDELDAAVHRFDETGKGADKVAKAYDAWQAATGALKAAQETLLPVVTNVHKATREFVAATREFPDAATAAGVAIEGLQAKANLEALALGEAQRNLNRLVKEHDALKVAYEAGNVSLTTFEASLKGVAAAQDLVAAKQAAVNKALDELPVITLKEFTAEINKAGGAVATTIPALQHWLGTITTSQRGIKDTVSILQEMGIQVTDTGDLIASKLIARYDELADRTLTLDEEALAWGKISGAVNKLAQTDLPAAIKLYDQHYAQITRAGATEAELLATQAKRLQLEIEIDGQTGKSATNQIIGLQKVKIAQQLLYDQTHMLGDLYVSVTNDILKGFDELGKTVADAIFDSKNLGDAFIEVGKKIGKTILEDIVGTYFKALKNAVLGVNTDVNGLSSSFAKLGQTIAKVFGGGGGGAVGAEGVVEGSGLPTDVVGGAKKTGSAFGGGGGGMGGTLGAIDAIAGIGTLISSIVGNFQMAKLETSLNAIEHNTRFLEIIFQKFAEEDEWQRHKEVLEALGNIFTRLGEVGIGVIQTVSDVTESIRQGFGMISGGDKRHPAALDPYTFAGPDAMANAILNGLVRGGGPIPKMEAGGPIIGDGLRYLHDGEWVVPRAAVPQMQGMSSPSSARTASVSVNAGANTFHIYEAANPRETARQVAEMLKILSPRFAPFAQ